jgi:hypothetical protein
MYRFDETLRSLIKTLCFAALLAIPLGLHPQTATSIPSSTSPLESSATLLAVVKDWASEAGYTGGWPSAAPSRVPVELLAVVTASGKWIDPTLKCRDEDSTGCRRFLNLYLNRPKDYTVATSPGIGVAIHVAPVTKIGDCFNFSSSGTLNASAIGGSAIASDHPEFFEASPALQDASSAEITIVRTGLLSLGEKKVRGFEGILVRKVQIEGLAYFIAERRSTAHRSLGIVFSIGRIEHGRFELIRWNDEGGEDGDTVESVLGVIGLKSGHEFLVTTESDPEGQRFYAYGIKDGHLQIIFKGGGSSC